MDNPNLNYPETGHVELAPDAIHQVAIAEYVAQLRAQLGHMPEARQDELCRELRQHLVLWVADHGHLAGLSPGAALGYLVREFGDPTTIGHELANPHYNSRWERLGQVVSTGERGLLLMVSSLLGYGFTWGFMHSNITPIVPCLALLAFGLGASAGWRWPHIWRTTWGLRSLALISAAATDVFASQAGDDLTGFPVWLASAAASIIITCGGCALVATIVTAGGALWQKMKMSLA